MSPFRSGTSPPDAESDDRLAGMMKPTVVLSATRADSWGGSPPEPSEFNSACADLPTTEAGILAVVQMTRDEVLAGRLAPAAVLDLVCRRAQFLTDAGGAVVGFREGAELVYRAAAGSTTRSLGMRVDTHRSLSGLCLRAAEAIRCDDTTRDGRVDQAACQWAGVRSMVLAPVVRAGRAGGVLAVVSAGVGAFGDRDVWTLRLMAEVLAEALGPGPFAGDPSTAEGGVRPRPEAPDSP
jgi:putative methionine-R-sulfoxide reductase with GAF domain